VNQEKELEKKLNNLTRQQNDQKINYFHCLIRKFIFFEDIFIIPK